MIARTHPTLLPAILLLAAFGAAVAEDGPPNIVMILADDLGYGDVQCLNPRRGKIATPHFDKLARQGMMFTDAHSGSAVCTPTRYGLLTGRYAWRTSLQEGVVDNYVAPLIAEDRLTLPRLLQQQGYHTACMGKWHLGFTVDQPARVEKGRFLGAPVGAKTANGPTTRGFDRFFGFHHSRMMESLFEDDRVTRLVPPVDMMPELTRRAGDYLAERAAAGRPFFLYLALHAPHAPIVPAPEWKGKSGLGDYGDFVMQTDDAVGQVLAALDRAGVAGNTLVIATSDNGCSSAADIESLERQGHFPSGEFRGSKTDIWEGGHRVPFLVRWPRRVPPGRRSSQLVCLTDVMATVAEMVNAKLPGNAGEDSFSFLADLKETGHSRRTSIVNHSLRGRFAIREGSSKLCLCAGSGGWTKGDDGQPVQLYDLAEDIGERKNLQAQKPDEVRRLSALLDTIVANGRSTPGQTQRNDAAVATAPR